MNILNAAQTAALLPYPALADAIAAILRKRAAGLIETPQRVHMPLPGGLLLAMPAADEDIAVTKLATVHPDNPERTPALPTIQGEVVVIDAKTGKWLGMLDGRAVTTRRTAALSLLAARLLAKAPEGPLLVVGAGAQAEAHIQAFREGLGVEEVYVASRAPERAMTLATAAQRLGMSAHVTLDVRSALSRCPLVVTATTSPTTVLPDDPGLATHSRFIAAVGAYTPTTREIPESYVRAARIYCDTLEGAMAEAGDLLLAGVTEEMVTPLEKVLDQGCPPKGPTLFKSVGHAAFDLAAAKLALG